MNDPEKILHGFLELSVSGDQLERFLKFVPRQSCLLWKESVICQKKT